MAREIVVKCERHRDRDGEEVSITVSGNTVTVDLCEECRQPLLELMRLGRPAGPVKLPRAERGMTSRIRGVPPIDGH